MYCLCEASGYLYRFCVYTRKEDPGTDMDTLLPPEVHGFSKAEKAVLYLAHPLLNKGHVLYMDNLYTSLELFTYLHEKETFACGTLRANRVPAPVKQAMALSAKLLMFCCASNSKIRRMLTSLQLVTTLKHRESQSEVAGLEVSPQ